MREIVITKAGDVDVLKVQDVPSRQVGAGEVKIKVKAAGVNFADVMARQGLYPDAPPMPCVVGYEVSGIIEAVGDGVDSSWIGKSVLGLTRFKGYAEEVVVPVYQIFEKPESLSFEEAASIPVVYLTAWQLIVGMGSLKSYESILIHNAGGGVGLAAIDIAKQIGATIYGTASKRKHEFLKERGLHHAIDYRTEDWSSELAQLTNGKGVDLIIDPLGGNHWKKSYKALGSTGRLGMFGISTSADDGKRSKLSLLKTALGMPFFHPISLMNTNKGAFGVNMGRMWDEHERLAEWMAELLDGVQAGWVKPYVDSVFSFDKAGEAHAYLEQRKNIGKVILVP